MTKWQVPCRYCGGPDHNEMECPKYLSLPSTNQPSQPVNPLKDFLEHLNAAARSAADLGATERLTVWVRQACIEYPMVNSFLAQEPGQLLWWLSIGAPAFYQQYITQGCGEQRAIEVVRAVQQKLAG